MTWLFRLLPILVLAALGFSFRGRLRQPVAFTVLGALVFFGVAWLVSQFTWNSRLSIMTSSPEGELAVAVLSSALVQFAVALVLSIVPIVWLYRLLASESASA